MIKMDFSDLLISGRPLKVMCRRPPYTVSDSDVSNWTCIEFYEYFTSDLDSWYIEVFP